MTNKELIEECTEYVFGEGGSYEMFDKELFAALVAAREREACAKECVEVYEARALSGQRQGYNAIMQCVEAIHARGVAAITRAAAEIGKTKEGVA